jgi:conjugal transfer pilus assembly protein TraV
MPRAGTSPNDVVSNYVSPRLPDRPVPVRTPAEVMRIWIAPWEDDAGDLIVTGHLYTEIEPRRWVIGEPTSNTQPSLRPLQSIQRDNDAQ